VSNVSRTHIAAVGGGDSAPDGHAPFSDPDPGLTERLRQLADVGMFSGLSPDQLRPLAAVAEQIHYRAGEPIVRQGDPGDSVYIIIEGTVEVRARSDRDPAATEAVVAWLVSGEAVGELSLLDGEPRSASCVVLEDTRCLRLERRHFLEALQNHWPLTEELLVVLARRLRLADKLMAEHARDPLTGLSTRRTLADTYAREASRALRAERSGGKSREPLAVLFADVNEFKDINDQHGHMTGDAVLRAVAKTLTAVSRASDVVARYGGDEFVMLLPEAGREGAEVVADRVRRILREDRPGPVPFSVSIGTAVYDGQPAASLEDLLARADAAMYEDKQRARS
jgi:diguanylate cyclase (GGDEF)-like protein